MKKSLAAALPLIVFLSFTGCRQPVKVVLVQPQPPKPQPVRPHTATLTRTPVSNLPAIPVSAPPDVVLGGAVQSAPPKPELHRHLEEHTQDANDTQQDAHSSATAGEEPSATTPIGQFSAAPNTQGLPSKLSISERIGFLQKQLSQIHRVLSGSQQTTASQIRTFLAKATNALQAGDLDGANTLTVKAAVLLNELK